jgi:hypothetical protein
MDYLRQYNALIATRKMQHRQKGNGVYYESHHIVPNCFGGDGSKGNLVLLTAKEHLLAHLFLAEIYSGEKRMKMWFALNCMLRRKSKTVPHSLRISLRTYERIKKETALFSSVLHKGKPKRNPIKKGTKRKPEHTAQSVKTRIERGHHLHSQQTKDKLKAARKFQVIDGSKISAGQKGNPNMKKSTESRSKISLSSPNRKVVSQFTKDGVFVKDYSSLVEAAKFIGVTICCISDCVTGRQKTSKGFIFKLKVA